MATSSFDKNFVVKDSSIVAKVHKKLQSKNCIKVIKKDIKKESSRGVALLKQSL